MSARIGLAGAALLTAIALPEVAAAHAAGINYRSPLPVWLYALAGALAVVASAPAAALAFTKRGDRTSRNFYPGLRRFHLGAIGLTLTSLLFVIGILGGLFGEQSFFENPMTILVWVDLWVGLGLVSALFANIWDFISPLSAVGRVLERFLASRGSPVLPYPARLGVWPSVALLVVWTWLELIWDPDKEPQNLALIALTYIALQLVAMAAFGTEVWLARGELFTVFARTLARFAPVELYVRDPAGPCRAGRCTAEDRIGCPSCWLDAAPEERGARLRHYGAGIWREPALGAGGGTFVLATLATVVYDGISQTNTYSLWEADLFEWQVWFSYHITFFQTLFMVAIVGGFALLYLAICVVLARSDEDTIAATARRYAQTLIPISAVYFIAHYFLYLVYIGQLTGSSVLDPLEREWVPDYTIWAGVPGALVWYLQVALIVWGHVVAVFAAHRLALRDDRRPAGAVLRQSPLVLLMAAYTFIGLWVLGQSLGPSG